MMPSVVSAAQSPRRAASTLSSALHAKGVDVSFASNPRIPFLLSTRRPPLAGPGGKKIIAHLVVNVEHWPFDEKVPRSVFPPPHGLDAVPDIPNYSWAEYGNRCGMPRILQLIADRQVPASANCNASVIDVYPDLTEAMMKVGLEFVGHGYHQRSISGDPDNETEVVRRALDKLESFTGRRTRGWLGPGLRETFDTPDVLKAASIDYVLDWVLDDLPNWMTTKHGPLLSLPYAIGLNDSIVYAIEKHSSPEIYQRFKDTLTTFERETEQHPRVLTIAVHPHLIGVPDRIVYLARILDDLAERDDVVFMNGSEICDWYTNAVPPPQFGLPSASERIGAGAPS
jgi:allantoinase